MKISVKIRKTFEDAGAMKAVASVTLDDQFAIHGVKLIETANGRFAAMPSEVRKDKDGNEVRHDIFHPISSSARKLMEEAVLTAYETTIKKSAE